MRDIRVRRPKPEVLAFVVVRPEVLVTVGVLDAQVHIDGYWRSEHEPPLWIDPVPPFGEFPVAGARSLPYGAGCPRHEDRPVGVVLDGHLYVRGGRDPRVRNSAPANAMIIRGSRDGRGRQAGQDPNDGVEGGLHGGTSRFV